MLLQKDLSARRELLQKHFIPVEGQFAIAKSSDAHAVEEIQTFLDESIKDSCEGLMVKMLEGEDAYYEPSRRSMNWLKLKKDYLAGVGDSFDLVVIGGYYGRGKRTSLYGAFLLACWDPESETYQAITKIGTGFTEEMLDTHYKYLQPLECKQKKGYYDVGTATPDIYFEPKQLWEVLAADLSLSPVYSAAKGLVCWGFVV
jgi:DNA ligase-1